MAEPETNTAHRTDGGTPSGSIVVRMDRDVAVITLNRPQRLNALDAAMRRDLAAAIRELGDGSHARGLVVTGAGRAFSAGEDLSAATAEFSEDIEGAIDLFHDITRAVLTTKVPTVAALNGLAVGGGSELTFAFDARIGTARSGYLLPENRLGLTVSNGTSVLLFRLLKARDAMRLVLDSLRVDAAEALKLGLLDAVVEGDPVEAAIELVLTWSAPGKATAAHLQLLRPDLEVVERAMRRETAAARSVWDSGMPEEAIRQFWADRQTSADGGAPART